MKNMWFNKLLLIVLTLFIIKIISINYTTFNLFGDEAQYWLWSLDLDFGYYSKPPLLAWVISAYTNIFGSSFVSLKLLPSIIYFFTAWSIFNISRNIGLPKKDAISCSLVFLTIPAVSFSSFILSTDILLLLFWSLSLNELLNIKKNSEIKNFVLFGCFLGLAFLSKYAAIYFILCLFIYILLDKNFRVFFKKNYLKFCLSFFCVLILILPNILWNSNNGWLTFQHTSDNINLDGRKLNLIRGLEFLVIQILMIGPIIFFSNFINYKLININKYSKLLLIFSMPIFFIVFIEAIFVRANANWAAPALLSFFLFLYTGLKNNILKNLNLFFNVSFCLIFFILIGGSYPSKIFSRIMGINYFAEQIFFDASGRKIVDFVVSDRLLFSSIKYELRERNLKFYMPHKPGDEVTNHFKISSPLSENMDKNFMFIGSPDELNYLKNKYSLKRKSTPNYVFTTKKIQLYEVNFD